MFRVLAFTSSLIAIFVVAAYLGRVSRSEVCINSPLVERLDIETKTLAKSLHHCGDEWSGDLQVSAIEKRWLKKIERESDRFVSLANLAVIPVKYGTTLTVFMDKPHLWNVSEHHIEMGIDVFEAQGQLERAFLISALKTNSSSTVRDDELAIEILADQILLLSRGEVDVHDPITGRSTQAPWPVSTQLLRAFQSESSLCSSPWKLGHSLNSCIRTGESVSLDSVRGLVTISSLSRTDALSISEKRQQLTRVVHLLKTLEVPTPRETPAIEDVVAIAGQYLNVIWDRSGTIDWLPHELNALVESSVPRIDLLEEFEFESEAGIFVVSGDRVQLYPGGPFLKFKTQLPPSRKRIRFVNTMTPVGELTMLKSGDDRVLEISLVQKSTARLKPYVLAGPKEFVRANPDLQFAIYHLPSIRLALSFGLDPHSVLKKGTSKFTEKMSNLLGLSGRDENKSYYNQAPIAAMEWFHF
jgi:hypothetical protein